MEITIQYFDDCPNWQIAQRRLTQVLGDSAEIRYQLVESYEEAERIGFRGSPTVLIDGEDPFADALAPIGLACRVYRTDGKTDHAPSVDELRNAIEAGA